MGFDDAEDEIRWEREQAARSLRPFVSANWILANVFALSDAEIAAIDKTRGGNA